MGLDCPVSLGRGSSMVWTVMSMRFVRALLGLPRLMLVMWFLITRVAWVVESKRPFRKSLGGGGGLGVQNGSRGWRPVILT